MTERDVTAAENQMMLQEEYLKNLEDLEEGQLIDGNVIEVGPDQVFVDIGYKSEGRIDKNEFETPPAIGDEVSVVLVKKEGSHGEVVVSKRKADLKVFWKNMREAALEGEPVEGTVAKVIKGGFEIDLGYGVRAFNPISKIDVMRVENPDEYLGLKSYFIIDKFHKDNKAKIVLTRRRWLEIQNSKRCDEFFTNTSIGDVVEGTVKSFTSFGAFIDLGGFDGLLHINDMSWGHTTRPKDFVKKGDVIKVMVIRLDPEEKKINLSLKHFKEDPWLHFEDRYRVDDVVSGTVSKLTNFGAFVEIEEGIEGLVHISELSWVKKINHPKEVLNVGDQVDTKILGYDIQDGRVSLGLKQVQNNPWDDIEESYPVGKRLTRKVKNMTNTGAFVELEEGIDGFLHVDDLSWTKRYKNPGAVLKTGDEIEVMVTTIDKEKRRIRVGIKQLEEDPWRSLKKAYPRGSLIEGEITNITDFGIFVRVQGGVEGLVSKYQLGNESTERDDADALLKEYEVGQQIKTVVTDISPEKQKLSLSVKELFKQQQRKEMTKYIHDEEESGSYTLGDMLGGSLKDKLPSEDEE